jgi:hypothetical protein
MLLVSVSSGTVHNLESARLSFPPLVRKKDENDPDSPYIWHTNLAASQQFWQGKKFGLKSSRRLRVILTSMLLERLVPRLV